MQPPRIYADFHKMDGRGRLFLTCVGTRRDLENQGIVLSEGLRLTFYQDELDVDGNPVEALGVVHFDVEHDCWVAELDDSD